MNPTTTNLKTQDPKTQDPKTQDPKAQEIDSEKSVQEISCSGLEDLRAQPRAVAVIDVRTGAEFETAHIPGSVNVPVDGLDESVSDLIAIKGPMVLVCQSGARATRAYNKLQAAGKADIYVLAGGVAAWQAFGGDTLQGDADKWAMDRQVRFVAGAMALGGVAASVVAPKAKWLSAGVAGGLVFSAVSNTCAMASVLGRLPYNRPAVDPRTALRALAA